MPRLHIASEREIKEGLTTDVYFLRTVEVLRTKGVSKRVYAEFTASGVPYPWFVFAGLEDALAILEGLPVDVYALPEGTVVPARDPSGLPVPVMAIEGKYEDFAPYETPVLGTICQGSGIATKAARIKLAAGDRPCLSFGIRRMHPAIAPFIDRAAYIGGCDGVSGVLSARLMGIEPVGTMPHALIILMGEEEAWRAFDEVLDPRIPRILLVDTFGDEKEASLRAARVVPGAHGVRLDTPGSRRGRMEDIVREVRWELDLRGFRDVKIVVSGGLDEESVARLAEAGADAFGVGTSISNAKTIDFAMDIVEVEGEPKTKKGKLSGRKTVLREDGTLRVRPWRGDGGLLVKWIENGKLIRNLPGVGEIREYVLSQLKGLGWRQE